MGFELGSQDPVDVADFTAYLQSGRFVVWGVGKLGLRCIAVAHKERGSLDAPAKLRPLLTITSLTSPCQSVEKMHTQAVEAMQAFTVATSSSLLNYRVTETKRASPDSREAVLALRQRWLGMTEQEVELEVAVAKATGSEERSCEQKIICRAGCSLRVRVREDRAIQARMIMPVDSPSLLRMSQFEGLEDLQTYNVCVETGTLHVRTLKAFAQEGHASSLSLLLLGRPGTGKTPLCLSLCSLLAKAWPSGEAESMERQKAATSTVDSLRLLVGTATTGICFDEFTPMPPSGRRECRNIDEVKRLLTVTSPQDIPARCCNFVLRPGPRVRNANASLLADWCSVLPDFDFSSLTDSERLAWLANNQHACAVLKRCAYCFVSRSVVPDGCKRRRVESLRETMAEEIRRTWE